MSEDRQATTSAANLELLSKDPAAFFAMTPRPDRPSPVREWLAETVRAAKAEALREAADGLLGRNPEESQSGSTTHYAVGCWISARADRIENGEEQ